MEKNGKHNNKEVRKNNTKEIQKKRRSRKKKI